MKIVNTRTFFLFALFCLALIPLRAFSGNIIDAADYFNWRKLAINPEKPDMALTITQRNELGFEELSDINQKVICAYNIRFDPGDDYHQRRDLTLLNGNGAQTLLVPATFVIAPDSTIVTTHVEANYTERMSVDEILKVLKT
ncbi:MAG: redoxin domain-containing protein [Cyclobacteriaceae bacterium]